MSADTLAAALPREMVRVAKLIPLYQSVPMGFLAAGMMQAAIDRAQAAIANADVIEMLLAYRDLQGFEA